MTSVHEGKLKCKCVIKAFLLILTWRNTWHQLMKKGRHLSVHFAKKVLSVHFAKKVHLWLKIHEVVIKRDFLKIEMNPIWNLNCYLVKLSATLWWIPYGIEIATLFLYLCYACIWLRRIFEVRTKEFLPSCLVITRIPRSKPMV